jgi:hypothetical protein
MVKSVWALAAATLVLAGCGGGGGGGGSSPSSVSSSSVSSSTSSASSSSSTSSASSSNSSAASSLSNSSSSSTSSTSMSSSSSSSGASNPPPAATVTVSYATKQINLAWAAVAGATYYKVSKQSTSGSGYSSLVSNLTTTTYSDVISVHLTEWLNTRYIVDACNDGGCTPSAATGTLDSTKAMGYLKGLKGGFDGKGQTEYFGKVMAFSGDGNTLAVGATNTNVDYVYVFTRESGVWIKQAEIKPTPESKPTGMFQSDDQFGSSLALSHNGNTLAVGASGYQTTAASAPITPGAVYIFARTGSTWTEQALLKRGDSGDEFGSAVALSAAGDILAVGAGGEDSNATGVDGDESNESASASGAVFVYTLTGGTWAKTAYIKASNTGTTDYFGNTIALSNDGKTLAVGAPQEDGAGNATDASGAIYIFKHNGTWSQEIYLKSPNPITNDFFGKNLALSGDGATLAAGVYTNSSNSTTSPTNTQAVNSGAVFVFTRGTGAWASSAYIKASIIGGGDSFGYSVALSSDGSTMAVGAPSEDSNAKGIAGDQNSQAALDSGAAYVFKLSNNAWSQVAYAKASNTDASDRFGTSVALSGDGAALAVGAIAEDSASATDQADNTKDASGAVYLY